jgi:hypothetical protein
MHLLLGHPMDLCCAGVLTRMEALGLRATIVDAPLAPPARLIWRLDAAGLSSSYTSPDFDDEEIDSVLVRDIAGIEPEGWDPADHSYMQSEMYATLLAWLEGLPCRVINRRPAALWYRGMMPLLAWQRLLHRCDLRTPETIVTNDLAEARNFARKLDGVVLKPLTGETGYLVIGEIDWSGVAAVQRLAPVCLTEPHEKARSACIIGDEVIWNGVPAIERIDLEQRLLRFASAAGLEFLEVAVAMIRGQPAVIKVDASPRLEHFQLVSRDRILDALVARLTRVDARVLEHVS